MRIIVSNQSVNIAEELDRLNRQSQIGGIATFIGVVRDKVGDLHSLSLEHYPSMTQTKLTEIANTAIKKFDINDITINHRVGEMLVGETIVFVAATSAHRGDCQMAVSFVMDYLKTDAPFWKMETYKNGKTKWITQRQTDIDCKNNWE